MARPRRDGRKPLACEQTHADRTVLAEEVARAPHGPGVGQEAVRIWPLRSHRQASYPSKASIHCMAAQDGSLWVRHAQSGSRMRVPCAATSCIRSLRA